MRHEESPAPALIQLGEIALSSKEYANAEELLRGALRYMPGDVLAQCDLSIALRLNRKPAEAAEIAGSTGKAMPLYPLPLAENWRLAWLTDRNSAAAHTAQRHC